MRGGRSDRSLSVPGHQGTVITAGRVFPSDWVQPVTLEQRTTVVVTGRSSPVWVTGSSTSEAQTARSVGAAARSVVAH